MHCCINSTFLPCTWKVSPDEFCSEFDITSSHCSGQTAEKRNIPKTQQSLLLILLFVCPELSFCTVARQARAGRRAGCLLCLLVFPLPLRLFNPSTFIQPDWTLENSRQSPCSLINWFHKQSCAFIVLFCFVRFVYFHLCGIWKPLWFTCRPFREVLGKILAVWSCLHIRLARLQAQFSRCIKSKVYLVKYCELSFTGVWWYRPRSLSRAWRWTQWAVLAPAAPWPLVAPQTSSLLLLPLRPRVWSTLQVSIVSIQPYLTSSGMLLIIVALYGQSFSLKVDIMVTTALCVVNETLIWTCWCLSEFPLKCTLCSAIPRIIKDVIPKIIQTLEIRFGGIERFFH